MAGHHVGIEGEQGVSRREGVEAGGRIGQVLTILSIVGLVEIERVAAPDSSDAKSAGEVAAGR